MPLQVQGPGYYHQHQVWRYDNVAIYCHKFFTSLCPDSTAIPSLGWFNAWIYEMRMRWPRRYYGLSVDDLVVATIYLINKCEKARVPKWKRPFRSLYDPLPDWAKSPTQFMTMFMAAGLLAASILVDYEMSTAQWLNFFTHRPHGITRYLVAEWRKKICMELKWRLVLRLRGKFESFRDKSTKLWGPVCV